jgi:hypothetical protein
VVSLFCRHNRFTADCPICSKGTVLEAGRKPARRKPSSATGKRPAAERAGGRSFSGPHVSGPARRDADDALFAIRLERVPGGVRLGEWHGAALATRAPVLSAAELAGLVARSPEALHARDAAKLVDALAEPARPGADGRIGVSRGRSGDFEEELRIEQLDDGRLRVARWVLRPGSGWELQDAPPMLPAARYAEALADAARRGLISAPLPADPATPVAARGEVDLADQSRPRSRPRSSL